MMQVFSTIWPLPALLAALGLAMILRRAGGRAAAYGAGGVVAAGWALLLPGHAPGMVFARLPVAAVIVWLHQGLAPSLPRRLANPLLALILAWWLIGAPIDGVAALQAMPVFVGLWIGLWLAGKLVKGSATNLGGLIAPLAVAAAFAGFGESAHWAYAALVMAAAALPLVALPVAPLFARLLVLLIAACLIAAPRGAAWPGDLSVLVPPLAWLMASRLRVPGLIAAEPAPKPKKTATKPRGKSPPKGTANRAATRKPRKTKAKSAELL